MDITQFMNEKLSNGFDYDKMEQEAYKKYPILKEWNANILRGDTEFNEVDGGYYIKDPGDKFKFSSIATDGVIEIQPILSGKDSLNTILFKDMTFCIEVTDATYLIIDDRDSKKLTKGTEKISVYINANTLDDERIKIIENAHDSIINNY